MAQFLHAFFSIFGFDVQLLHESRCTFAWLVWGWSLLFIANDNTQKQWPVSYGQVFYSFIFNYLRSWQKYFFSCYLFSTNSIIGAAILFVCICFLFETANIWATLNALFLHCLHAPYDDALSVTNISAEKSYLLSLRVRYAEQWAFAWQLNRN